MFSDGTASMTASFSGLASKTVSVDFEAHWFGAPTYTWTGTTVCHASRICYKCSYDHNQNATITGAELVAPTCTDMGTTRYTATFAHSAFNTQTKDAVDIPAINHDYDYANAVFNWSGYTCPNATVTCKNDSSHVITVDTDVTSSTTPASCVVNGYTDYTASFTVDGDTYTNIKTETLTAPGHSYVYTSDDNNTHHGTCSACNDTTDSEAHTFGDDGICTVCGDIAKYTVTWKDWDGSNLEIDENVPHGTTPSYDGEEPSRVEDEMATYEFSGWNKTIGPVTGNVTYTAKYNVTYKTYTLTFLNYDGEQIWQKEFVYGNTPVYDGPTPVKPFDSDKHYTYNRFLNLEKEPGHQGMAVVTEDATYTAQFNSYAHSYTYEDKGANHLCKCNCGYSFSAPHQLGPDGDCVYCHNNSMADYSDVNEAIDSIPSSVYFTSESYAAVTEAKENIDWSCTAGRQGEVDAMAAAINAAIDGLVPIKYNVAVPDGSKVSQQRDASLTRLYWIAIVETPAKQNGEEFSYWAKEDGTAVSTYRRYAFFVTEDTSLHPVYGADREDEHFPNYVCRVVGIRNNLDGTYSILVDHSVTSAASIMGHGVMITSDSSIGTVEQQMLISNQNLQKYAARMSATTRTGLLEIPVVLEGDTFYARAYIMDAEGEYHYGDIQTFNISEAITGDSTGEIIMTDIYETSLVQPDDEAPVEVEEPDEPEAPSVSGWDTILNRLMALIEKIIGYFKLAVTTIKF